MRKVYILVFLSFLCFTLFSQTPQVKGVFLADSVKIGEQIVFSLSAHYPKDKKILFPDTTFSFLPFEIQTKKYYPTRTRRESSVDSVHYYLTTFEIDSIQFLRLPVFLVNARDCTAFYTIADSVILQHLVHSVPDSIPAPQLPLKISAAYEKVSWIFNYPIALIVIGSILFLTVLIWILFGKRIKKYFKLKKLHKNYQIFCERFSGMVDSLSGASDKNKIESIVGVWKKYMENLTNRPFTKLTSRELIAVENDLDLGTALKSLDRSIYGGHVDQSTTSYQALERYAKNSFQMKIEEVRNG
ncbi:MAG: hypothetical protein HC811_02235 [Flammeovirgaceae bacterium]|nr:hypothetical protein [Flammeovirgaceae bacterium]